MAQIKDLEKYIDYEFSSGCYTGDDYKGFQTKYINFLRSICKQNHWQLVNVGRNHYCFSAFIKSAENKCVYVSILASNSKHKKIVISAIEHSSIFDTCVYLKSMGVEISIIPVDSTGQINIPELKRAIDENTILVSIIAANNEIGTIQDLKKIDQVCFEKNVPFHTDASFNQS